MPAKAGFANNTKVLAAGTPVKAPFDAKRVSPRGRTRFHALMLLGVEAEIPPVFLTAAPRPLLHLPSFPRKEP